jgi:DNA recombination protein RmuC
MAGTTFLAGIVLALALGAVLGALWMQARRDARGALPVADTLGRIEKQMREMDAQRRQTLGGLGANLESLTRETVAISQALRSPQARGRWGELTLRRVAELAGMAPYCDFTEQEAVGTKRPDMLVRLPGSRLLAVDAKAPLNGLLEAEAAPDEVQRKAALERHAKQLWQHVMTLSSREYWSQFDDAPEMVVLFLPGEQFLGAALERDQDLLDRALARKVIIATPVTLVSVLKGVAFGWRQEKLARNAEELRKIAGEFQDRVRVFGEAYADSGRHLARAVEAYNRSAGSWDTRLLPSLKRMKELGAGSAEPIEPARIDAAVRLPQIEGDAGRPV